MSFQTADGLLTVWGEHHSPTFFFTRLGKQCYGEQVENRTINAQLDSPWIILTL